jgi:hypothetical protein
MGECKIEDVKNSTVYVEAVFNFLIFSVLSSLRKKLIEVTELFLIPYCGNCGKKFAYYELINVLGQFNFKSNDMLLNSVPDAFNKNFSIIMGNNISQAYDLSPGYI